MKLKSMLSLFAIGICSSAYGGHPAVDVIVPVMVPVTIPEQEGSWSVAAEAQYFRPSNGDFNYATTRGSDTFAVTNDFEVQNRFLVRSRDRDPDWGGRFDVKYLFPDFGRDINVVWTHYHHDDASARRENEFLYAVASDILTPSLIGGNGNFPGGWDTARPKAANQYDAVDVMWGQHFDFGPKVRLRAFGGLRYGDIQITDSVSYSAVAGNNDEFFATGTLRLQSDFQGLGPRGGMDARIRLGCHTNIVGTIAGSLLVGDLDQKRYTSAVYTDQSLETTSSLVSHRRLDDSTVVVPEMDARIGFNYLHPLSPDAAVLFEVGYENTHYWNGQNNSVVSYTDSMSHYNDVAFHGPYLRVQLDVA